MRVGHFILAALIVLLLVSGFFFNALDDTNSFKWWVREGHQSLGVLSIVLLTAYCLHLFRQIRQGHLCVPVLARVVMLLVTLSIAVSGYLLSMPYGVSFFSLPLPVVYEQFYLAGLALQWHFSVPTLLGIMVSIHAALGIHATLNKKR